MKRTIKRLVTLVAVSLLAFIVACIPLPEEMPTAPAPEPTLTADQGIIEIRVTDPPPADVTSAVVYLTDIEVHKVSNSDNVGEWIPIVEAPPSFDLLKVIEVEEVLGSANVTAGNFTQIRMYVDRVEVVTAAGDNITAEVPSGKLKIVRPFNVGGGVKTVLTLDFDGEKSLILPGKDVTTGKERALFKPVIKLLVEKEEIGVKTQEKELEKEKEAEGLEFEGTIDTIEGDIWMMTIEDESWTVDVSEAEIKGEPAEGLEAEVKGIVVDSTIVASEVEIEEEEPEKEKEQEREKEAEEVEFEGTIEAIDGDTWLMTIDGEDWTVDVSEAEIVGEPAIGLEAEGRGTEVDDTIVVNEVMIEEPGVEEEEIEEFEGVIEAIDGNIWIMDIEDESWTVDVSEAEIRGEPEVGLEAEVAGIIEDDTIIALEVEIEEEEE